MGLRTNPNPSPDPTPIPNPNPNQGGIHTLVEASRVHVGNVKVQARVVRALTNLSVHDGNKPKIATVHGITALINASLEHG